MNHCVPSGVTRNDRAVVESGHVEQGQVLATMKTHTPYRTFDGAKYLKSIQCTAVFLAQFRTLLTFLMKNGPKLKTRVKPFDKLCQFKRPSIGGHVTIRLNKGITRSPRNCKHRHAYVAERELSGFEIRVLDSQRCSQFCSSAFMSAVISLKAQSESA
jgi:hypothetical protein